MNPFPLIRNKWSNEHIMAGVFGITLLYLLPRWIENPGVIPGFLITLTFALIFDAVANFLRYKKLVCGVSAAVTVAVMEVLTPGIPLWGSLLGILVALGFGKHLWGGTGKNPLNPALTGVLFLSFLFNLQTSIFPVTLFTVLAMILSIQFIRFRPFAAIGFMAGMIFALLLSGEFLVGNLIMYGVVFWGCLVVTDPVTVSSNPLVGFLAGLSGSFISLYFSSGVMGLCIGVLGLNILSFFIDRTIGKFDLLKMPGYLRLNKIVPFSNEKTIFSDLTEPSNHKMDESPVHTVAEILNRIGENEVFGYGGAGFSTYQKIKSVIESKSKQKHLIINGVECDSGLIHDQWLMQHLYQEIVQGIGLLRQCLKFESVILAVKDTKNISFPKEIVIHQVPERYPIGAEKILIREIHKKNITPDGIPSEEGFLVLNIQTVYWIYQAVVYNHKAENRFLTVVNSHEKTGLVVKVPLGMKVQKVVEKLFPDYQGSVFIGGGLMQCQFADDNKAVDKSVNFIALSDLPYYKESALCSKCDRCSRHCPVGLDVRKIAELIDNNDSLQLQTSQKLFLYHPEKCLGCGSCSYICLADRNLSARIKVAKEYVKKISKNQKEVGY